jgi:hypothetical protein
MVQALGAEQYVLLLELEMVNRFAGRERRLRVVVREMQCLFWHDRKLGPLASEWANCWV